MKRFVCLTVVSWLSLSVLAQTSLSISTGKTTSLIFPFGIRHVDRGSEAVLAQTIKEAPTVL
ncbi:MAG TPA: hypothetical protein VEV15_01505, partial [Flavisolibacter sp.]|nr:hypothetical protein [Flavisolibacter sp.]